LEDRSFTWSIWRFLVISDSMNNISSSILNYKGQSHVDACLKYKPGAVQRFGKIKAKAII